MDSERADLFGKIGANTLTTCNTIYAYTVTHYIYIYTVVTVGIITPTYRK